MWDYDVAPDEEDEDLSEAEQRREYFALVQYARKQLYDYYGTACHFTPGAYGDLSRIRSMSPDEILREAQKNGLI